MNAYVIKVSGFGFLSVSDDSSDVYIPHIGSFSTDLRSECYFYDQEIATQIFKALKHRVHDIELLTIDEARIIQQENFERQKEDAIQEADEAAERGEGLTEEEWDVLPDTYIGNCYKLCYGDQMMVKGSVYRFGIRGVYVCSGCSYAYPPGCEPEEVKKRKKRGGNNMGDTSYTHQ